VKDVAILCASCGENGGTYVPRFLPFGLRCLANKGWKLEPGYALCANCAAGGLTHLLEQSIARAAR
jgi:hypothetical protein